MTTSLRIKENPDLTNHFEKQFHSTYYEKTLEIKSDKTILTHAIISNELLKDLRLFTGKEFTDEKLFRHLVFTYINKILPELKVFKSPSVFDFVIKGTKKVYNYVFAVSFVGNTLILESAHKLAQPFRNYEQEQADREAVELKTGLSLFPDTIRIEDENYQVTNFYLTDRLHEKIHDKLREEGYKSNTGLLFKQIVDEYKTLVIIPSGDGYFTFAPFMIGKKKFSVGMEIIVSDNNIIFTVENERKEEIKAEITGEILIYGIPKPQKSRKISLASFVDEAEELGNVTSLAYFINNRCQFNPDYVYRAIFVSGNNLIPVDIDYTKLTVTDITHVENGKITNVVFKN